MAAADSAPSVPASAKSAPVPVSLTAARRFAVTRQRLAGARRRASGEEILALVRELCFVQWDPVTIVAPSHLLSLWARLEGLRPSTLERLLWKDRTLFEHWTPIASLVLTEDYPIYRSLMRRYPDSLSRSWGSHRERAREFLDRHAALRRKVLAALAEGPRTVGGFKEHAGTRRDDGEWTYDSDLARMLFELVMTGDVMVVGHEGNQNLWGLTSSFLPRSALRAALAPEEFERTAARRALAALGPATPAEINYYFVRGRYDDLRGTLRRLESEGVVERVVVEGTKPREERYLLARDLAQLTAIEHAPWRPRVALLPPFDNMLGHSLRAHRLFGFDYVREQFLPAGKRRFGTYVLPILSGERFIGRIDPRLDKGRGVLVVNAVHAEPGAPDGAEIGEAIAAEIARLAEFVGAREVAYPARVPSIWKRALR